MGFLKKLFGKKEPAVVPQHLVRLHIPMPDGEASMEGYLKVSQELASTVESLSNAVTEAGVGELDGDEYGGGEYTIWFYGPDARPIAEVIRNTASFLPHPPGCTIFMRLGDVRDDSAPEVVEPL